MKGFRWYLIKTFKSFKKARSAYDLLDVLGCIVDVCDDMDEKVPFEAFYTFVATHKSYLKILNINWDGFDKYLRTKTRYFINIKTQKLERCEPI